jgi:hypothetical protein
MQGVTYHRASGAGWGAGLVLGILSLLPSCGQPVGALSGSGGAGGATSGGSGGRGQTGAAGTTSSGSGGTTGLGGNGGSGASAGSGGSSAVSGSGGIGAAGSGDTSSGGSGAGGSTHSGVAGAGGAAGATATTGTAGAGGSSPASSGCAGRTYKLCEDFETGVLGGLPSGWTTYQGYGKGATTDVGLANDQAHSGSMSLKSDSAATGQRRAQTSLAALGATASKHWGRVFYKVQAPAPRPSGGNVLHVTFVGLWGSNQENRVVDTVESSSGSHQWLYNNPDDKGSEGSAYNWTFDSAWHCAEWYVDVSTESYRFFSDGTEVTQIGFVNKTDSEMVGYTAIIVGATFYQMPPSTWVMWFDDLAIDDNQIGCQ